MDSFDWNPSDMSHFDDSTILTTTYKIVHGHEITTDILYPRTLSEDKRRSAPCPILLRYHGGGLVAGSSLFPPFFNPWYLELAKEKSAIIVSPDYRLMPEVTVFEALEDFGGGYLSIFMGLRHSDEIRAVNAAYPLVNPKSARFTNRAERPMFGMPSLPKDTLDRHLEMVRAREAATGQKVVFSVGVDQERTDLVFSIAQHGLLGQFYPSGAFEIHPLDLLDAGARFPRDGVLILHGLHDTAAPIDESYQLKKKVEEVDSTLNFRLVVRDGKHGFDHAAKLHDPWLWEAIQGIVSAWLT
ncbi:hypothetical protein BBP40_003934 [Aspergillus hancockii]|nr:hypothetical protein BBP40_003934 [Aspergillus hancockii]